MTSLIRYKRSKGYGIHSPFAYSFITDVLRERHPYYAYADIELRRRMAINLATDVSHHPRIISYKNVKMLFRLANYFNPNTILQIGTSYGVSTTALLDVTSSSTLYIYTGPSAHTDIYRKVTHRYGERITSIDTLADTLKAYNENLKGKPFVLVNSIDGGEDYSTLSKYLLNTLNNEGVVIIRNLTRNKLNVEMLQNLYNSTTHGMTFSNGNLAIIVGWKHLPHQQYSLWY
jgi:predicted O-methyltransferase YrrM